MYQVHLWRAEEQASYPGHPPAAVPEGSRSDSGPQGGESPCTQTLLHAQYLPSYKTKCTSTRLFYPPTQLGLLQEPLI